MPRSSRHKSHKQSKHSSKDTRDYCSDSEEDVKMKERNSSKEEAVSARVLKDSSHSASGEKRKLSSSLQFKDGKDGKDLSGHGNGDVSEEYVSSKRRKDKSEGSGTDRWNGGGDEKCDGGGAEKDMRGESSRNDSEKGLKNRESKGSGDSKSRSSKRHESSGEKEEKNVGSVVEKEESRSGSGRAESKRKSEKDSGRKEGKESKEVKEKERGSDRDNKKGHESRRESEVRSADGVAAKKHGSQSEDVGNDRQSKRGREHAGLTVQDDFQKSEAEKELEKRIHRRREGSDDRDKYQDARESDERRVASRVDRSKDGKYKEERYKDGNYGDKYEDNTDKDDRHRDEKYQVDDDNKDIKHRDDKYREDGDRDSRHRDDKYRDDSEREKRRRENKYREDGDGDDRRRDDKYREDGERDGRHRDDKLREDNERENRSKDDKYGEDADKDSRRDDRYYEDCERDVRHRDDKYREEGDRHKEEKRLREAKHRDERSLRDRSSDKSEAKHLREDGHTTELYSRKSSMRESSPNYDDRVRLKDDQGRKRTSDKEDHSDTRSRGSKDQRYDAEKRSASGSRADLVTDRGRSSSRNADLELTPNRSRHQTSPSSSSHVTRDHYRFSKQDESKYREYGYEERVRHSVTSAREYGNAAGVTDKISSSRSIEKIVQRDEGHFGELSAERRLKSDSRTSPRQLIDKSPSSTSADRRYLGRSDVRRAVDVEESGQRSGGPKDAKDYPVKEGRGSRELATETLPGDELSHGDGDSLSVSSPFGRTGHLSSSSKSLLPPPPFRAGIDSPLPFGSSEDDSRMKFNNRHRRIGDPNMGRVQGSPWKSVPNWPSPVANGFMPFQHGPPSVGFHPVMQQFPAPPMFGMRPSMELNHPGVPYHIPDPDRFTGHGRPLGWRNPVDDSCPPPLHSWDANNATFGEESHIYGRPDWDHGRTLPGGRGWEAGGDLWKGPKSDASMELPSASEKENQFTRGPEDVTPGCQSGQQAKSEQVQLDSCAESIDTSQLSDALDKKTMVDSNVIPWETINVPKMPQKNDVQLCHFYLSMLDISADLTEPELYDKCTDLINVDEKIISDADDTKILYVEVVEAKEKNPSKTSSASLFSTINDSLFQKAMTLYEKQRENFGIKIAENSLFSTVQNKMTLKSEQEKLSSDDCKDDEMVPAADEIQLEDSSSHYNEEVEVAVDVQKLGEVSANTDQKLNEPVFANISEKSEEAVDNVNMSTEIVTDPEVQDPALESSGSMQIEGPSGVDLPARTEEEPILPNTSIANLPVGKNEEEILPDNKCGSLLLSDVSSKACEVVMPELIESGSVNLSRIHHSPESTH